MLRAILNKSWRQHPTRHQLYGHLPPIAKTIQVRRTRHAGHCWKKQGRAHKWCTPLDPPPYGRAKAGRPARTYIQQLCGDTGCSPENLPEDMNDREKWREKVKDIHACATTWWCWWWFYCTHFIYLHTVKWALVLLCNTNKYYYSALIIQLNITHLFAHSEMVSSIAMYH